MATTAFNASCRFSASRRPNFENYVGLRARTMRIRYARSVAAPRLCHLVKRENNGQTNSVVIVAAAGKEIQKERYPGEAKGFVEELRFVSMRLHPTDQEKKELKEPKYLLYGPVSTYKFTVEAYLRFLVNNKLVYDTIERVLHESTLPIYDGFKNTGMERGEKLRKDLEWFKDQGYKIPEPMGPGLTYSQYLNDIAENDPPSFVCHFYNIYFAHSAGGRLVGTKASERLLDNKELEFYKWDGQLSQLLHNMREELNQVGQLWTREEKNHCLEETEKSFKFFGEILRILLS